MSRRMNKLVVMEVKSNQDDESFDYYFLLFLRDCKIRNLSEHTLQYYKNELVKTVKRLEREGVSTLPAEITADQIKEHVILSMMREGLKETTINSNLRAIHSFFNFLERECFVIHNPARNVKFDSFPL